MKRVLTLAGVGLVLWLAALAPASLWLGNEAVIQCSVALAICLAPALATLLWAECVWRHDSDMRLLAALGGSGIRLLVTLGVGAFLYFQYPETYTRSFWGWVAFFYLVLLGVEVFLLVRPRQVTGNDS